MKNFNYKGKNIRPQRIKVKQGPKIEEVFKNENGTNKDSDFLNNRNMAKEINKQINENAKTPNWNFLIIAKNKINIDAFKKIMNAPSAYLNRKFTLEEYEQNKFEDFLFYDNNNANPRFGKGFMYLIELNLLAKSSGINLNVSDDGFVLTSGSIYKLLISLPFLVNSKDSYSYFDGKNRYLYVFLPFYEEDSKKFFIENEKLEKSSLYPLDTLNKENNFEENENENDNFDEDGYSEIVKFDIDIDSDCDFDNDIDNRNISKEKEKEKERNNLKKDVKDIIAQISDDYLFDVIV
jgi:hypothetical protein